MEALIKRLILEVLLELTEDVERVSLDEYWRDDSAINRVTPLLRTDALRVKIHEMLGELGRSEPVETEDTDG